MHAWVLLVAGACIGAPGLVVMLEWLEAALAAHGQLHLAGEVCRMAVSLGMFGPCSQ